MVYYDDMYHPTNCDDDSIAASDAFSVVSWLSYNRKKSNDEKREARMADKGYYFYKKLHNNRRLKIEMYDSGTSLGSRIRDPVTGSRLYERVGSSAEKDFFKVRWCGLNRQRPVTLFYDSPENYERHHRTTLSDDIKQKWWNEHRSVERPRPIVDDLEETTNKMVIEGTTEEVAVTVVH